jgi:glycosyltransferase involved in cell wall biosynthesis
MSFVFFSAIHWDWVSGAHLPVQLTRELARRGIPVLFVQPQPSSQLNLSGLPIKVLSLRDLGLAPNLAVRTGYGLDVDSLEQVGDGLLAALHDAPPSNQPQVAVWFAPFAPFARLLPLLRACGFRLIYYPNDDFADMVRLGFYRHNLAAEDYLGRECEAIITPSQLVAEKMERFGKCVQVIPVGLNLDEFRAGGQPPQAPPQVLCGERTLGFWGWLSDTTVDVEALAYVAHARPNWTINLLGTWDARVDCVTIPDQLKNFPNIRFHGEVEHRRLKDYAPFFDICLIPSPDSDFSRGRDPIKVYEYLALHKPVVCTHMPQLAGMPYLRNASTPQEFLQELEAALVTPIDAQVLDAFLATQTWEARADALLEVIGGLGERGPAGAPLPVSAVPAGSLVAPRFVEESLGLKEYLNALETDLAQTRTWARELENAVIAKDRELRRIYHFLPIRLLRWLYHLLA